jgi:hypothetical protein
MGKRRISGGATSRVKRPRLAKSKRTTTQRPPEIIEIPSSTPSPTLATETLRNCSSSGVEGDETSQNATSTIIQYRCLDMAGHSRAGD